MAAPQDVPEWIERAVAAARALGMNPVRVRWKLVRAQKRWRGWMRRTEQRVDHVRYAHKTCPQCGAVQDRAERACSRCGEALGARRWQVVRRLGLSAPKVASLSGLLGVSFVVIYGLLILRQPSAGSLFGLSPRLLIEHGGHVSAMVAYGQWWRLATACFLHAGLWHVAFNLFALAIVGPRVEALYGRGLMLFTFLLCGVVGNLGSGAVGLYGVGIGASGGLMGLVGIVAGWGHRDGTRRGRSERNDMIKWALYTVVFGFFIGADNWAHAFGFASGLALGLAVRPSLLSRRAFRPFAIAAGAVGALGCAAAIALVLFPAQTWPLLP